VPQENCETKGVTHALWQVSGAVFQRDRSSGCGWDQFGSVISIDQLSYPPSPKQRTCSMSANAPFNAPPS